MLVGAALLQLSGHLASEWANASHCGRWVERCSCRCEPINEWI